ncbi:DUF4382 domain-containing protein [Flavicella sediminum]|uniref:DUF4382 domain-containing protein n=1 Tax=Flavicella sediminum TaxID=2585141 RepID=UPI0011223C37|nr:DUF4382 domain-containing protein [Flavicella sediminum]
MKTIHNTDTKINSTFKTISIMKTKNVFKTILLAASVTLFTACAENEGMERTGEANKTNFHMTDAPTDNTNVKGVIVTVADVQIDGVSIEGFSKTTIDLLQYQNGVTELLGNLELQAGTYSNINLVLDYETDASGNSPGCFVELKDRTKTALQNTQSSIQIKDSFEVFANTTNNIVLDFDVRKAIVSDNDSEFKFVSTAEMRESIRIVNEDDTAEIEGNANDMDDSSEKIIVYAYEKGTFNAATETQGQGQSNVLFANAVSSSFVSDFTGNYSLNFIESGEYELHFASYTDEDNDGELEFSSVLIAESITNIDLTNLNVNANVNLNIAVNLTASNK